MPTSTATTLPLPLSAAPRDDGDSRLDYLDATRAFALLLVSGWIMGAAAMRGDVDIMAGLLGGWRSLATLPDGLFTGSHLWFLYYLAWITALVVAVRALVLAGGPWQTTIVRHTEALLDRLANSPTPALPLVIWLQVLVSEWPLHWTLKLLAVCAITIALCLASYDLLVRSTFLGHALNGRRRPRVLLPWVLACLPAPRPSRPAQAALPPP